MHTERELQFKSFVPAVVECLAHADGGVRDVAKNNLVELFRFVRLERNGEFYTENHVL